MDSLTIVFIAVGLAMDAFAVSIARGITTKDQKRKKALIIASFFGVFQMAMPFFGWLAGLGLKELIMGIDHWIAFGLLVLIGSRMIHATTKKDNFQNEGNLRLHTLLTLAIATSIDALMVGLSFALLQTDIIIPVIAIGIVTFSLSCLGFLFGNAIGNFLGKKIEVIGGLILIIIGVRILIDHLIL